MSFPTFATRVPAYFLGRPREVYAPRYGTPKRAEVIELGNRTGNEAMRLRAVA
ncbi:MAG: hypothetical protein AAGA93_28380 [Actinomycetota bacterium]